MKKHNMEKAAHGNSGVNELNTRESGVLTSAKKTISTLAGRHMAKIFVFLFCVTFLYSAFAQVKVRVYLFTTPGTTNVDYRAQYTVDSVDQLPSLFYNTEFGILFTKRTRWTMDSPSLGNQQIGWAGLFNRQIATNGTQYVLSPLLFPQLHSLYFGVESLLASGYEGPGLTEFYRESDRVGYNVNFPVLVSDVLSSTNTTYRQLLLSSLSTINSTIRNATVDLGQFQRDYQIVNYGFLNVSNYIDSAVSQGLISAAQGDIYKGDISSAFRDPDIYGDPLNLARSIIDNIRDHDRASNAADYLNDNPSTLNDFAKEFGDSLAAGGSHHYTTPLTNEMKKMSADWKDAVTNDLAKNTSSITNRLAQNTVSITNQLAQWKRDLHDDVGAVGSDLNSVIIPGNQRPDGNSALRVDANVNIGELNVSGTVKIDPSTVGDLRDGFGSSVGAAVDKWIDEWRFWAYDNPDSWREFYRRLFSDLGPSVVTNQDQQISLLVGVTNALYTSSWTNELVGIISNGVAGLDLSLTNELWDYYFDRFKKANEFRDDEGFGFGGVEEQRFRVFGNGFDEAEYNKLDWFSRVELLLYQIGYASTNEAPEIVDLEGQFDDVEDEFGTAGEDFVAASVKVVGIFGALRRFTESIKLAFVNSAAPSTDGIVLLQGGSWLVDQPLVLRIPINIQNMLRLVFQCIWYLSAFVIGWRIITSAWDKVVGVVRWLWSVFDV